MRTALAFLKTTLLGGVLFLVPLVVLAVVLAKAIEIMLLVAEPVDQMIPTDTVGGVAVVNLIAILAILAACFMAGLLARSALGRRTVRALDDRLLIALPGYSAIKGKLTGNLGSDDGETRFRAVVARLDDYSQIAFEIERFESGTVVVFLPGSPDPWASTVAFMTSDRIEPLDLDFRSAAMTLRNLGRGSGLALMARANAVSAPGPDPL